MRRFAKAASIVGRTAGRRLAIPALAVVMALAQRRALL